MSAKKQPKREDFSGGTATVSRHSPKPPRHWRVALLLKAKSYFDWDARNKNLDRTCLVDELSGGQFVLVNEAVNLGIAIYNMRQGEGVRYETLFRDETVGALDAANGKEYVRMLRRAMDLGGFHQVIFICHTPLVWELANDILSVGGGQVMVGDQETGVAV